MAAAAAAAGREALDDTRTSENTVGGHAYPLLPGAPVVGWMGEEAREGGRMSSQGTMPTCAGAGAGRIDVARQHQTV